MLDSLALLAYIRDMSGQNVLKNMTVFIVTYRGFSQYRNEISGIGLKSLPLPVVPFLIKDYNF